MTAASGGPDWGLVLAAHRLSPARGGTATESACECSCGATRTTRGTRAHADALGRTHVAAALNAELVRWLASDEPVRVLSREVYDDDRGPTIRIRAALTALAGLTGGDQ